MAYIVAYTLNHGNNDLEDVWMVYEDRESADKAYWTALEEHDNLHCAAVTQVLDATEPHWMDDVGQSKNENKTKLSDMPLTSWDVVQAMEVVWSALSLIPEGVLDSDDTDQLNTAMAWIEDELGLSYIDNEGD